MNTTPLSSQKRRAHCFSGGIARIPSLLALLPEFREITRRYPRRIGPGEPLLGWGRKPTADRVRRLATQKDLPYLALEDGFLRSLGLGVDGYPPCSLAVDRTGIYYDATRPSDLERLIIEADFSPALLARAEGAMAQIREQRLSKYNHAPDRPVLPADGRARVLVVDQTFGDASVTYGGADAATFTAMLEAAISENPGAEVVVKTHPDVIAGKKKGYLLAAARSHHCRLVAEDVNPWALFDGVERVYAVTSQLGFEALLAGREVHCFGMPFYAGWGLTRDRQTCERRGTPRTLAQLFAAAYLGYCRYANPYTGQPCELEAIIDLIADQKRQQERLRGAWLGVGFSRWKRRFVPTFMGPAAGIHFADRPPSSAESSEPSQPHLLAWASRVDEPLLTYRRQSGRPLWRMEDGFVRSVGLGVDLERPLSLVIDGEGIYYDATRPSDLEHLLANHPFPAPLLARARRVRERLVELGLSKYNVGTATPLTLPENRRLILVPGQVESDASIALGSPVIKTNQGLLAAVRAAHPDAFILYKPHPDVLSGARVGALPSAAAAPYDLLVTDVAMPTLLGQVDEVHTLCSLTGFEALLRGIQVHTYGLPFYAGWGLTEDLLQCERRNRRLTLDQLVAATLLLYPTYVEPDNGQLCNLETIIELIAQRRERVTGPGLKTRLWRVYRGVVEGVK